MSERLEQLKADLTTARAHLNRILDQVGDRWETPVYSEGAAWNARQLLLHLMISDKGQLLTLRMIAEGGEGVPADFDLERYNRRSVEKQAETSIEAARAALDASAAERESWLASLDDAALERSGRHGSGQIMTVEQILSLMARHERSHADDIARALNIA
jgi:uncharacterized damage-inducible protein DinB